MNRTTPSFAPPTRKRRKEARPRELLDAALDLFVTKGFAATRTHDVAARAGVSKGTLYLYFSSKEELLKDVIRHHVVNQIAEGRELVGRFEGSSSELLALVLRLWWERIGEAPASGIIKLMMSEVGNFPEIARFYFDEVITPSNQMLVQLVQRGVERHEFRAVDVPQVVEVLVATMLFLVMNKHSLGACATGAATGHTTEPKAVIAALIDVVLRGLEVPAHAPSPAAGSVR